MCVRLMMSKSKVIRARLCFIVTFLIMFFWKSINVQDESQGQIYQTVPDGIHRKMCNWNVPNTLSIVSRKRDLSNLETADLFQVELCKSQSLEQRSTLEDAPGVLLFIDDGFEDRTHCGIGCRFMRLDMALWFAYANRMSLHSIPNGRWEYTSAQVCPHRNHECYFQSLVSHPLQEWQLGDSTLKMINSLN